MLSEDDRERLKEALAKLEAEKEKRAAHAGLPYIEQEINGETIRIYTFIPRSPEEAEKIRKYIEKNPAPPPELPTPEASHQPAFVVSDAIADTQKPRRENPPAEPQSGRVWIQVDAGDGENDCGEIAEASFTVEDDCILLTIGKEPQTQHALLGGDPVAVAKKALREKLKKSAFNRRLRYPPPIGIA